MSNPFEYFANDDEDEQQQFTAVKDSHKQKQHHTHAQKRLYKQQQSQKPAQSAPVTQALPEKHKEDAKQIRNPRHPPTPVTKKLGQGHYHDRRSGTGRVDKVRKAGGGKGNVGNVKDDLNQDKYIKQTQQENVEPTTEEVKQQEVKPEEPESLTLEEYYKTKGVDIQHSYEHKDAQKKSDVNAEWIKKEKLTVMETKEDKKAAEKKKTQNIVHFSDSRSGIDENLEAMGFNSKPKASKPVEKNEPKPDQKGKSGKGGKGGRKQKVVLNDDDFPTL